MDTSPAEHNAGDAWLELSIEVPEQVAALAAQALLDLGATGTQEDHPGLHFGDDRDGPIVSGDPRSWTPPLPTNPTGTVQLKAWFGSGSDPETLVAACNEVLAELGIEDGAAALSVVADQDWNAKWKAGFTSFRLSPRIQVVPSWSEHDELEDGVQILHLDPGMAFGTGTHFTTAACAQLLDELLATWQGPPPALLDVGTGTGILALVGLRLGAARVVAVDADPQALDASRENARINQLADKLELSLGGPELASKERFGVVMANLIAPVLLELAEPLSDRVKGGGSLILSGILCAQEAKVLGAFSALGLLSAERRSDGEWVALRMLRDRKGKQS